MVFRWTAFFPRTCLWCSCLLYRMTIKATITEVSKVSAVPVCGELLFAVVWSTVHCPPGGAQAGNRVAVTRVLGDLLQPLYPASTCNWTEKALDVQLSCRVDWSQAKLFDF